MNNPGEGHLPIRTAFREAVDGAPAPALRDQPLPRRPARSCGAGRGGPARRRRAGHRPRGPALDAGERGRPPLVRAMLAAGVDLREHPAMAHAKVVLADDTVLAGTANLDALSLRQNWEVQLRIEDPAFADQFARELFDRDVEIATPAACRRLEGAGDERADVGDLAAALAGRRPAGHRAGGGYVRVQPAVDAELDAVDRRALEQERGCRDDVRPSSRGRPVGVRVRVASSAAWRCSQYGLLPTIPGWMQLTRIGFSSWTSARVRPSTPPLTVVTVVEPRVGQEPAPGRRTSRSTRTSGSARSRRTWTTSA